MNPYEKDLPQKKCPVCEGTGYEDMVCNNCLTDIANCVDDMYNFSPDGPCPVCRHRNILTFCKRCKGEGKTSMSEEEYEDYKNDLKFRNQEKY